MTPEQKELARHALGLTKIPCSYRNYFFTGPGSTDHLSWVEMVALGYAQCWPGDQLTGPYDLFRLTPKGAKAALEEGETLCHEDFP